MTDEHKDNEASIEAPHSVDETRERLRKLRLENEVLEFQASGDGRRLELLKTYAGIGGLITAAVAALAFLLSVYQVIENFRISNASLEADRFGKALALLSENRPAQRLTGVTYLTSLLAGKASYYKETSETLANMLGLEEDQVVRRSIRDALVNFVRSAYTTQSDLSRVQNTLTALSRDITSRHLDFLSSRHIKCEKENPNDPQAGNVSECNIEERLVSISEVIEAITKIDNLDRDLNGIYCNRCDLTNLNLDDFIFDGALPNEARFNKSSLNRTSFRSSGLVDTNFQNTHLRNANFNIDLDHESYVFRDLRLRKSDQEWRDGPNFQCADLSGATFSLHPVFRVVDGTQSQIALNGGPIYWWANLEGADFTKAAAFSISNNGDGPWRSYLTGEVRLHPGSTLKEWYLRDDSNLLIDEASPYWHYLHDVSFAITNANWKGAKWPVGVRFVLDKFQVEWEKAKRAHSSDEKSYGSGDPPFDPPEDCLSRNAGSGTTKNGVGKNNAN